MSQIMANLHKLMMGPQIGVLLYYALELKIPQRLSESGKSVEDLIEAPESNKLERILQCLETAGIFQKDPQKNLWHNTEMSSALIDQDRADYFKWNLHPFAFLCLSHFPNAMASETSACELATQKPFFEVLRESKDLSEAFQNCMKAMTKFNILEAVDIIDFQSNQKVLDVGGGDATLVMTFALKNPSFQGGVYELPQVAERAKKQIQESGLTSRLWVETGDFFEEVPKGYDAIVLKHILHDWPDEKCIRILKNCREALAHRGKKLYIIDIVLDKEDPNYEYHRFFDIKMLVLLNAMERTQTHINNLLLQAGFQLEKVTRCGSEHILEATTY